MYDGIEFPTEEEMYEYIREHESQDKEKIKTVKTENSTDWYIVGTHIDTNVYLFVGEKNYVYNAAYAKKFNKWTATQKAKYMTKNSKYDWVAYKI